MYHLFTCDGVVDAGRRRCRHCTQGHARSLKEPLHRGREEQSVEEGLCDRGRCRLGQDLHPCAPTQLEGVLVRGGAQSQKVILSPEDPPPPPAGVRAGTCVSAAPTWPPASPPHPPTHLQE